MELGSINMITNLTAIDKKNIIKRAELAHDLRRLRFRFCKNDSHMCTGYIRKIRLKEEKSLN